MSKKPTKQKATPKHLGRDGSAFYSAIVTEYEIADAAGAALLTRAAECVDRLGAAHEAIAKHGEIVKNQYGMPVLNPATKLEKEARDGFLAAMRQLRLDVEPPRKGPGRPPIEGWKGYGT